jgi:preprotein translocase subunit SecE
VARNRKRAKERRARRPQPVGTRRSTARAEDGASDAAQRAQPADRAEQAEGTEPAVEPADGATAESTDGVETEPVNPHDIVPSPVEEADDANPLAHAAPNVELADEQARFGSVEDEEFEHEEELVQEDLAEQAEEERERALPATTGERVGVGHRLVGFLQGSWRELQRVQWPDRRQVAQATGVVLGFVIIAGAFLGLSDLVAQKVVNFILK